MEINPARVNATPSRFKAAGGFSGEKKTKKQGVQRTLHDLSPETGTDLVRATVL